MNKVILQGKIVTYPYLKRNLRTDYSGKLVTFYLETEEVCLNHKTGERYKRTDRHSVVVWGPLSDSVITKLGVGSKVQIEGAVRVKSTGGYRTAPFLYSSGSWVPKRTYVNIEATSIKVKKGKYYRCIDSGRF